MRVMPCLYAGLIVSATSGARPAEHGLDGTPVFDGMIAAGRRLFVATVDERVVCLAASDDR